MDKTMPMVRDGILIDDQTAGPTIHLDTPAWFAWSEAPTTGAPRARFSYALSGALWARARGYIDGFMTVRKEKRQQGGAYWLVGLSTAGASFAQGLPGAVNRSHPGQTRPDRRCLAPT